MPFIGNQPALSYTSFAKQDFTTSATTSYTLDHPVTNENEIALFINFVRQEPSTAYTASNTTLTLTSATSASDDMYCVFLGKAVQTVNPPSGSVGLSQLSATGTKDSTTFLRGDNTFASAGGDNQPYFTAYQTGDYSINHNTATTVVLPTTTVNSGSDYNTSTGRFTPQVAGDYFVTASSTAKHGTSGNAIVYWSLYIQKNGAYTELRADTGNEATSTVAQSNTNISGIISMNGSTDYLTYLAYQYDYSANAAQNLRKIQFSAFKII